MAHDTLERSSRLSGFYQKSIEERTAIVAAWAGLSDDERAWLRDSLTLEQADKMIENVVGRYSLPLGIAANFRIDGRDVLVPMAVEEPSVVAAVSFAARLARSGGGFFTGCTAPIMIAQVQLLHVPDPARAEAAILAAKSELLRLADVSPTIARLGGGPVDIQVRRLPGTPTVPMLIVHLLYDVRDAMGANVVNTAAETIAPRLEQLSGGRALLRILSNLTDQRRAWAEVLIPGHAFAAEHVSGAIMIENIAHANAFAVADPHRAVTHNKGIMNGVDAVALATGNDWRAIEAGAHAWAARSGRYQALTEWRVVGSAEETPWSKTDQSAPHPLLSPRDYPALYGRLEMPLAVGIVGGATRVHPMARIALKILGVQGAQELAQIMVAVGLAQNLAALRALASEGIQAGHMTLHARQVAVAAGAQGEAVDAIAAQLIREGQIRVERARELWSKMLQSRWEV